MRDTNRKKVPEKFFVTGNSGNPNQRSSQSLLPGSSLMIVPRANPHRLGFPGALKSAFAIKIDRLAVSNKRCVDATLRTEFRFKIWTAGALISVTARAVALYGPIQKLSIRLSSLGSGGQFFRVASRAARIWTRPGGIRSHWGPMALFR